MTGVRDRVLDRLRTSLFFVPMVFVLGGAAAGSGMVALDRRLQDAAAGLPFVLTTTVDGARETVATVAQATITFAGVAFSVSLLIFQLASSQYSPRVVGTLFRDPFNRRVMAIVMGTFTYCLMVLRSVRGPFDDGGTAVVPNLSVALAVVLGVVAILATVAFIDHSAHTMEISSILRRVTDQTLEELRSRPITVLPPRPEEPFDPPAGPGRTVVFEHGGWIQHIDRRALLELLPDGGTVQLHVTSGAYAVPRSPLCTVWPPGDGDSSTTSSARNAVQLGVSRTVRHDPAFGIRQLADVALKALSNGVNDPTTAQDALFHMTDVLGELLRRDHPETVERDERGRRLLAPDGPSHDDLVGLAYDELRRQAATLPSVCHYLLESIHLLVESLQAQGLGQRTVTLRRQAALVVEGCAVEHHLPVDLAAVQAAHDRWFPPVQEEAAPMSGSVTTASQPRPSC